MIKRAVPITCLICIVIASFRKMMVVIIPITWIQDRGAGKKRLSSTDKIGVWVRETLVKTIIEP